jgi:hypothetical protein
VFEKIYIQDDVNRIIHITQSNIGKRKQFTLSGFAPIPLAKWYMLQVYAESSYSTVDALYNSEPLNTDYLTAIVNMQHAFIILPTLRGNVQMMWVNPGRQGIVARLDDFWTVNAQIEKTFMDRRLSLALACNDLFSSMVYNGKIHFGNINQDFREDHHLRQITLTVRYNFGSQQIRSARSRNVGIEEEMRRTK